ncbi:MAG TPA: TetR/AcrR family transcriptional regulator [Candidatus Ozemobacteraceae bacterium]|nr:TetR/AcrR family transcriptional regulator [Candidatus Ozemobacteraceae bacterium]HQG27931.1 TetR/AcrR family transcriptional regulator [Candidatus Ozemobacteraceae bacterium]
MATPRQKQRNERMLHAALDEFSRQGYHQASVDTIARKAKVSKATIYSHFGTKEALFLAVFDLVLHTTLRPPAIDLNVMSLEDGVRQGVRQLFTQVADTPEARFFFQCMTSDAGLLDEELRNHLANRFIAASLGEMKELEKAQKAGLVSPHLNIELIHHALIGMVLQAFRFWWSREKVLSADILADQLSEFFLFGLAGPRPSPAPSKAAPKIYSRTNTKNRRGKHP